MNDVLVSSFQQQKGLRGVHFYDGEDCEFVLWDLVIEACNRMKDKDNPSHLDFEEKLLHAMANVHPENEYVLVRQIGSTVTIECYREHDRL